MCIRIPILHIIFYIGKQSALSTNPKANYQSTTKMPTSYNLSMLVALFIFKKCNIT